MIASFISLSAYQRRESFYCKQTNKIADVDHEKAFPSIQDKSYLAWHATCLILDIVSKYIWNLEHQSTLNNTVIICL